MAGPLAVPKTPCNGRSSIKDHSHHVGGAAAVLVTAVRSPSQPRVTTASDHLIVGLSLARRATNLCPRWAHHRCNAAAAAVPRRAPNLCPVRAHYNCDGARAAAVVAVAAPMLCSATTLCVLLRGPTVTGSTVQNCVAVVGSAAL